MRDFLVTSKEHKVPRRFFFFCRQYTIAMLGYGPEEKNAVMELTYNYGVTEYDKGNAYAQVLCFL